MKKRYVGLDLSSKMGVVILDDDGKVVLDEEVEFKDTPDPERMYKLWQYIEGVLNTETDSIIIEGFSFGSKGQGSDFQYGIGWLVRTMLFTKGVSYLDVAPTQVKKFATGKGNSAKPQMILPIYKKWGYENTSDNVIDAYILARIGYSIDHQEELKNLAEKGVVSDLLKPTKTARKKN